ncbi:hypothetical protein [Methanoculleus chikugoensis]|uniref:hypothetical protein n=1 Tax=Methanoculleus chikugoensis TaxID=118126 RepID=UPI001FB4F0CC|nr:hypothetical protein [Methanoculleus chikugoensis]
MVLAMGARTVRFEQPELERSTGCDRDAPPHPATARPPLHAHVRPCLPPARPPDGNLFYSAAPTL